MPDCYLHVGFRKTGSSAIQAFLRAKRDDLLARGLLVPLSGMGPNGKHAFLARATSGWPVPPKYARLLEDLSAELQRHPELPVLVSDEILEKHFRPRRRSSLVAFFRARGYRVCLVGFVRPQPDWMNAGYVQLVKAFRGHPTFVEHMHRVLSEGLLFYSRWLRIARAEALELRMLPYDAAVRRDGVFPSFLRALEVDAAAPDAMAYRENASAGVAAVAAARTCMDRLAARGLELSPRQRTLCNTALAEADQAHPTPPFSGLTPGHVATIEDWFWGDNRYFARAVWGRDWEDVFGASASSPACNEVDREDPSAPGYDAYAAILDQVWPEVLRIAQDTKLSRRTDWEIDNPAF